MSGSRRWMIPVTVLAVSLALGWWWRRDGWQGPSRPFWRWPATSVTRLEIAGQGQSQSYAREGDAWVQLEPFRQPADVAAIRRLLAAAADAVPLYRRPLAGAPEAARLSTPDATLVLRRGDGTWASLRIGADHPAGLAWVAEESAAEAGPCPAELRQRVLAALAGSLRDDHVFELAGADSDRVIWTMGGGDHRSVELERTPAGWRMLRPWASRADGAAVVGFLQALADLRVQGMVHPDVGDGSLHGLADPVVSLAVRTLDPASGKAREETLRLGAEAGQGARFARIGERPPVVQLDPKTVSAVLVPAVAFLDPRACGLEAGGVDMVRVMDAEGVERLHLQRGDEGWSARARGIVSPVEDRGVRELLRSMCETRATGISSDPARPEWMVAKVELRAAAGGQTREVRVWRLPDGRWAMADEEGPLRIFPDSLPMPIEAADHPPKR